MLEKYDRNIVYWEFIFSCRLTEKVDLVLELSILYFLHSMTVLFVI